MTTQKAIATLREKMGLTQSEFAGKLGVTITSVSRYENGREPSAQILKKLAAAAEAAQLIHLRDFFISNWRAGIVARIEKLPSSGTGRHIPLDEMKRWAGMARHLAGLVQNLQEGYTAVISKCHLDPKDAHVVQSCHRNMWSIWKDLLPQIYNSIEPYINEPIKEKEKTDEGTK
jgi:transcriptional regulator with XRE-family HTH domain